MALADKISELYGAKVVYRGDEGGSVRVHYQYPGGSIQEKRLTKTPEDDFSDIQVGDYINEDDFNWHEAGVTTKGPETTTPSSSFADRAGAKLKTLLDPPGAKPVPGVSPSATFHVEPETVTPTTAPLQQITPTSPNIPGTRTHPVRPAPRPVQVPGIQPRISSPKITQGELDEYQPVPILPSTAMQAFLTPGSIPDIPGGRFLIPIPKKGVSQDAQLTETSPEVQFVGEVAKFFRLDELSKSKPVPWLQRIFDVSSEVAPYTIQHLGPLAYRKLIEPEVLPPANPKIAGGLAEPVVDITPNGVLPPSPEVIARVERVNDLVGQRTIHPEASEAINAKISAEVAGLQDDIAQIRQSAQHVDGGAPVKPEPPTITPGDPTPDPVIAQATTDFGDAGDAVRATPRVVEPQMPESTPQKTEQHVAESPVAAIKTGMEPQTEPIVPPSQVSKRKKAPLPPGKIKPPAESIRVQPIEKLRKSLGVKAKHPAINSVKVEGGVAMMFDDGMDVTVHKASSLPDGVYELAGNDLIRSDFPSDKYPVILPFEGGESIGTVRRSELIVSLARAANTAPNDDSRYALRSVKIDVAEGGLRAIATDGNVMSLNEIVMDVTPEMVGRSFLLPSPKKVVKALQGIDGDSFSVDLAEGRVRFTGSDGSVTVLLGEGNYPKYYQVYIGAGFNQQYRFDSDALRNAVKAMKGHDDDKMLDVEFTPKGIVLTSPKTKKTVTIQASALSVQPSDRVVPGFLASRHDGDKINIRTLSAIAAHVRGDETFLTVGEKVIHAYGKNMFGDAIPRQTGGSSGAAAYAGEINIPKPDGEGPGIPPPSAQTPPPPAGGAPPPPGQARRPFSDIVPDPETIAPVDMPEMLRFLDIKKFSAKVMKKIGRKHETMGMYRHGKKRIEARADIFKDTEKARYVIGHEIFHYIDDIPEPDNKGNILGHIAAIKHYMKHTLGPLPGMTFKKLTDTERKRLKDAADEIVRLERLKKDEQDAVLMAQARRENITPDAIKAVFNDVLVAEKNPVEQAFIKSLSDAEKVSIVKEAMKGILSPETQAKFADFKNQAPPFTPSFVDWDARVKEVFRDLVRDEIRKRGIFKRDVIIEELKALSQRVRPFNRDDNPSYTRYRDTPDELFADAGSVLLRNPKFLYEQAPDFYHAFFSHFSARPEVKDVWDHIQAMAKVPGMTEAELSSRIQNTFARSNAKFFDENRNIVRQLYDLFKGELSSLVLDPTAPLLGRYKRAGMPLGRDVAYKLEEYAYRHSTHEEYASQIYNEVTKHLEGKTPEMPAGEQGLLSEYLVYKRIVASELERANPWGVTPERAQRQLDYMRRTNPARTAKFEELGRKFGEIRQRLVVKPFVDAGIPGDEMAKLMEERDSYVTFLAEQYIDQKHGAGSSEAIGFIQVRTGMLGGIGDALTATVLRDMSLINATARKKQVDRVMAMLISLPPKARGVFADPEMVFDLNIKRLVPKPVQSEKGTMVRWLENGKMRYKIIDDTMAYSLIANPGASDSATLNALAYVLTTPFKRVHTVLSPPYLLFNILRDSMGMVVNVPGVHIGSKLKMWVKAGDIAKRYAKGEPDELITNMRIANEMLSRMKYPSEQIEGEQFLQQMMEESGIAASSMGRGVIPRTAIDALKPIKPLSYALEGLDRALTIMNHKFKYPGMAVEAYQRFAVATEVRSRIATRLFLDEMYPNMSEAEKAHWVRVGPSPAFLRRGRGMRAAEIAFTFLNANKEAMRTTLEILADPRYKNEYIRKLLLLKSPFIGFRLAVKYGLTGLIFGTAGKTVYDYMDDYHKDQFNVVPLGFMELKSKTGAITRKAVYLTLPKTDLDKIVDVIIDNAMDAKYKGWDGVNETIDQIMGIVPGQNPLIKIINSSSAYLRNQNYYDSFRRREIFTNYEMEAGGWPRAKRLLSYVWENMGGDPWIPMTANDPDDVELWLEKMYGIPLGVGMTLRRFVRVSDKGLDQRNELLVKDIRAKKAVAKMEVLEIGRKLFYEQSISKEQARVELSRIQKDNKDLDINGMMDRMGRQHGVKDPEMRSIYVTGRTQAERRFLKKSQKE